MCIFSCGTEYMYIFSADLTDTSRSSPQFSDIVHFQQLVYSTSHTVWPAVTEANNYGLQTADGDKFPGSNVVCDSSGGLCTQFVTGNMGSSWNYGDNFGGPTKSTWTSGADTDHSIFGSWGVVDEGYDGFDEGMNGLIPLCKYSSVSSGTCRG